jgi:hypothetical protein
MLCIGADTDYVDRVRPRSCAVLGRSNGHDCDCGGDDLVRIVWSHWGSARATGTATENTLHNPPAGIRVKIAVARLEDGRCGRVYTRLIETSRAVEKYEGSPGPSHTLELPLCPRATG